MRSVAEYWDKAKEFAAFAADTDNPAHKKRYADLAECYRLLAQDRQHLVAEGVIPCEPPNNQASTS